MGFLKRDLDFTYRESAPTKTKTRLKENFLCQVRYEKVVRWEKLERKSSVGSHHFHCFQQSTISSISHTTAVRLLYSNSLFARYPCCAFWVCWIEIMKKWMPTRVPAVFVAWFHPLCLNCTQPYFIRAKNSQLPSNIKIRDSFRLRPPLQLSLFLNSTACKEMEKI